MVKSSGSNPYSTGIGLKIIIRLWIFIKILVADSMKEKIFREVLNDKIANAVLKEEIYLLDEFKIIGRTLGKTKETWKECSKFFNFIKNYEKTKQSKLYWCMFQTHLNF